MIAIEGLYDSIGSRPIARGVRQGGSGTSRNAGRSRAAASCAHQSSRPDGDSYPSAGGVATKMTSPGHSVIVGPALERSEEPSLLDGLLLP
jgi:hypothetical protein